MLEQISLKIARKVCIKEGFNEKVVAYGLEIILSTTMTLVGITTLAAVLGYGKEMIVYILAFAMLRAAAGGRHASNHLTCFISYFLASSSGILITQIIPESGYISATVCMILVSMILVYIFAPTQTPNRPIFPKERVKFRKRSAIFMAALTLVITLLALSGNWNISLVVTVAVFTESLTLISIKNKKLEESK